MASKLKIIGKRLAAAACAGALGLAGFIAWAAPQDPESGSRQIYPEEFIKARPAKSTAAPAPRPSYRRAGAQTATAVKMPRPAPAHATQLGLTIWRLRPAAAGDGGARILVHEGTETVEWVPERVEAGAPLGIGERVRLSIESEQTGYLYVIDREQYADGTLGEPHLIFPTTRTRGGDHRVTAGRLIDIPGQEDRPNYFTLRPSRPDQVGERLTVIVTPQPIEGLSIGSQSAVLSRAQVAEWEKAWGASVERFELAGGAGRAWTPAEQAAAADATRLLTQEDPGPQTVYRAAVKPGRPLLVQVELKSQAAKAPARRPVKKP